MIYNGSTKIIKIGNDNAAYDTVRKIYQYYKPAQQETDWSQEYFTFTVKRGGEYKFFANDDGLAKSTDGGQTWTSVGNSVVYTASAGDKVMFKGNLHPSGYGIGRFSTTIDFDVEGNIMSLLFGDNFATATDLTGYNNAFTELFQGCSGLLSAENLVLPAATLAPNCYHRMFGQCTSLTTAPVLPAKNLPSLAYNEMFYLCSSLNYIKMLAETREADALQYWTQGVASSGTFVKSASMTTLPTGTSGIPSGWTVVDA